MVPEVRRQEHGGAGIDYSRIRTASNAVAQAAALLYQQTGSGTQPTASNTHENLNFSLPRPAPSRSPCLRSRHCARPGRARFPQALRWRLGSTSITPMRSGESIRGRLLYPIYADNQLLLAEGYRSLAARLSTSLRPQPPRAGQCWAGTLRHSTLPRSALAVSFLPTALASHSLPAPRPTALRSTARWPRRRRREGFVRSGSTLASAWHVAISHSLPLPAKSTGCCSSSTVGFPTIRSGLRKEPPGRRDNLLHRLPAQPAPPALRQPPAPIVNRGCGRSARYPLRRQPTTTAHGLCRRTWRTHSAPRTSSKGQAIQAVVAEPIYNPDQTLAVPQGAMLVGAVTRRSPRGDLDVPAYSALVSANLYCPTRSPRP